jgi:Replication-relaxation
MTTSSQSHRRGAGTGAASKDEAALLEAPSHLTERDRWLVRLVGEHRVLTTSQLTALGFANLTTARHRLSVLVGIGLLRRFRPHPPTGSAPWHYVLGPIGAALLGVEDRDERKWAPQARADRALGLEHSPRLGHMTGSNQFFVALAAHARHSGGELREWLNEAQAAAHSVRDLPVGLSTWERPPHPDGAGTWAEGGRQVSFLLEFDTGTEDLARLAAKLDGYAVLASVLADADLTAPPLLFCFGSPRREQAARRALAATRDSAAVRIATTAIDPGVTSPAGPVWLPLSGHTGGQVRLIDLDAALPDPWQHHRQLRARQRREAAVREQSLRRYDEDDMLSADTEQEAFRQWP